MPNDGNKELSWRQYMLVALVATVIGAGIGTGITLMVGEAGPKGERGPAGSPGPRGAPGLASDTSDLENTVLDLSDQVDDLDSRVSDLEIFGDSDLEGRVSDLESSVSDLCFELDLIC